MNVIVIIISLPIKIKPLHLSSESPMNKLFAGEEWFLHHSFHLELDVKMLIANCNMLIANRRMLIAKTNMLIDYFFIGMIFKNIVMISTNIAMFLETTVMVF